MIYVIGSGPSGVACATALIQKGLKVTMLDVGNELEKDKKSDLERVKKVYLLNQKISHPHKSTLGKDLQKRVFNSDFAFSGVDEYIKFQSSGGVTCLSSFAKGGLSNTWGAGVEKFPENEFKTWPIKYSQIVTYYDQIYNLIKPVTAHKFEYGNVNSSSGFQLSRQARHLLNNLVTNREKLDSLGLDFGASILATNFSDCAYCGNCQHGCPLDLIYSASHTLETLKKHTGFTYIKNIMVNRVRESGTEVEIFTKNIKSLELKVYKATRIYIACGAAVSTLIAAKSMNFTNKKIKFKDSSHITIPSLMFKRFNGTHKEALHTLFQLYLKIDSSQICKYPIHFSIYTYMDFYEQKITSFKAGKLLLPILRIILDRLIILKIHLNSSCSHGFTMTALDQAHLAAKLVAVKNMEVNQVKKRILKFLYIKSWLLGFIPIFFLSKTSDIARSFHYGGSFPMSETSTEQTSDIYGRPFGLKKVHLVDSSIFPTIPAGSITATIMANAFRISDSFENYQDE